MIILLATYQWILIIGSDEDESFVHTVWKFDNFSATQILREINLSFLALILEAFSTVTLYKVT